MAGLPQLGAFLINVAISFATSLLIKALTPPVRIEGQKLRDLNNTESAFGTPIPKCFGTFRLAGNCIWQKLFYNEARQQWLPFEEIASTEHVGKGGGGATVTNYSYYWTGAIMFAVGPAVRLRKVWAHTKLIIDNSPGSIFTVKPGIVYRFYRGTDDQQPDPAIEEDVDGREGEGSTPGYTGRVYIVFDHFPLKDFGNTLPKFSAEIVFDGDTESQFVSPTIITEGLSRDQDFAALNWYTNTYYTIDISNVGPSLEGIRKLRASDNTELAANTDLSTFQPPDALGYPTNLIAYGIYAPTDGQLYVMFEATPTMIMARLDPDSLTLLDYAESSGGTQYNQWRSGQGYHAVAQWWASETHGVLNYLMTGSQNGSVVLWALNIDGPPTAFFAGDISDDLHDPPMASASYGYEQPIFYAVGTMDVSGSLTNTASFAVWKFTITHGNALGVEFNTAEDELIRTITVADMATATGDAGITGFDDAESMVVDQIDGNPIFSCHVYRDGGSPSDRRYWVKVDNLTGDILWAVEGGLDQHGAIYGLSIINGSMVMRENTTGTDGWVRYNTVNGEIIEVIPHDDVDFDGTTAGDVGFYSYNYVADAAVLDVNGAAGPLFFSNVDPQGVTLASIVQGITVLGSADGGYAGLQASDIDVTELTDLVPGYAVLSNMSKREAIEPLARAYFFDGVESDYLMKFRKFGQAPIAEIESGDMVRKENFAIAETREDEAQMPGSVSVSHFDWERDHLAGTQLDRRISNPSRSGWSDSKIELNLPIVMTPASAKAIARRALYTRWIERDRQAFMNPRPRMLLDPLDTVTLIMPDHEVEARLTDTTLGMDWSLDCASVAEEASLAAIDEDAVTADGGSYFPQTLPTPTGTMRLYILDGPYLRDVDVGTEAYARTYLAASPVSSTAFSGATVFESMDGLSWEVAGNTGSSPNMGVLASDLAAPASPDRTDTSNTIHVRMWRGTPENITQEQFRNFVNAAILLNRTSGELEYICFRDAEQNADGSWTLSHLRRGARGTDGMPMEFTAGDYLIFPTVAALTQMRTPLAQLNLEHIFRPVPVGGSFDTQPNYTRTIYGRELMPYAPVCVEAVVDSSSNIDLAWTRRTRFNGEWLDGEGDVPLNEEAEEYEVDVYSDDTFSTVLRTLDSVTPAVQYDAADVASDFGSTPDELNLMVYQMGQTGRGFARRHNVQVMN